MYVQPQQMPRVSNRVDSVYRIRQPTPIEIPLNVHERNTVVVHY
jgi:hypothetical protein